MSSKEGDAAGMATMKDAATAVPFKSRYATTEGKEPVAGIAEFLQLIALISAIMGLLMRIKWAAWLSFVTALVAAANANSKTGGSPLQGIM